MFQIRAGRSSTIFSERGTSARLQRELRKFVKKFGVGRREIETGVSLLVFFYSGDMPFSNSGKQYAAIKWKLTKFLLIFAAPKNAGFSRGLEVGFSR